MQVKACVSCQALLLAIWLQNYFNAIEVFFRGQKNENTPA